MFVSIKNFLVPPVMGSINEVANKDKKPTEAAAYYVTKVELAAEGNEFWLLFTKKEVAKLPRVTSDVMGLLKQGRLYAYNDAYLCRVVIDGNQESLIRFPQSLVDKASRRAQRNIEDIPDQSWLSDLLD